MPPEYAIKLEEIQKQIENGTKVQPVTARTFIAWFGAQRRSSWNVLHIRVQLAKYGLVTKPDFDAVYIDGKISFERRPDKPGKPPAVADLDADPTYRIARLAAANRPVVCVSPDASISEAITLMLFHDYSQLPVMTTERDVKGVICWVSLGSRLALGSACKQVRECMDEPHVISAEIPIFAAIDDIIVHQYALIRDGQKVIAGIVTTTDLSILFRQLGEPFLLLGEIENYIRRIIQDKFTADELVEARDPTDSKNVEAVSDLSFGEYVRLLENPARWSKLKLSIDRATFVKQLEEIRQIRNDVMHFDSDGPTDSEMATLRSFVKFMRGLADLNVI